MASWVPFPDIVVRRKILEVWLPVPAAQFPKMALCPDKSLEVKRKKETKQENYRLVFLQTLTSLPNLSLLFTSESHMLFFWILSIGCLLSSAGGRGSRHILPQHQKSSHSLQKEIIR